MAITCRPFGMLPTGQEALLFTLTNRNNVTTTITNYGGKLVTLLLPDKNGRLDDIILGFDTLEPYTVRNPYLGTLVGRCANRIRNASFTLNDVAYHLDQNADPHHLHGGWGGFDKKLWQAQVITEQGQEKLELTLLSEDGDQGYPGNLWVTVKYSLDNDNRLAIEYDAHGDADTIVNLTNHNYFNLNGHANGSVDNHEVCIDADWITDLDDDKIANGKLLPIAGTPFDFNTPHTIGERRKTTNRILELTEGYDVNYQLNRKTPGGLEKLCRVYEATSGRGIEVYTTLPAMQLYTANYIKGNYTGKGGVVYQPRCGLCLETQNNPNSPNCPQFPSIVLKKGDHYNTTTVYRFTF